jgi:hypothetical protein
MIWTVVVQRENERLVMMLFRRYVDRFISCLIKSSIQLTTSHCKPLRKTILLSGGEVKTKVKLSLCTP